MEQLKSDKLVPVLLVVVVVMAFMMGTMWNKLQSLEGGSGTGNTQLGNNPPAVAPAATVLTDDQFQKIVSDGNPASVGRDNAPVTIVEFSDLQCPFCKQFVDSTYAQIKSQYIDSGDVRVIFRHYPLRSIHPVAYPAALAAECAKDQGKFWEFHDEVFKNQATLSADSLKTAARTLGLNTSTFNNCLDSEKHKAVVEADEALGNSVGVTGTPAFFVNGKLISGAQPFSAFQAEIDAAL